MDKSSPYLMVFSTCPDQATARNIASVLVEQRLAACVNIVAGLESVYIWNGVVETDQEYLLIVKTHADRYAALEKAIVEIHPYELPEIVAVEISEALPGYLSWIGDIVKGVK